MTSDNRSTSSQLSNRVLYLAIISFLIGLFIGLVVLGWWLWPVQWTDSYPEYLSPPIQEDYLRMAIDSYSVNGDAALAQARYASLGQAAPQTLSEIQQSPGAQDPAEIAAFAQAVGAPAAPSVSGQPGVVPSSAGPAVTGGWQRLLPALCLIAILLAALIFWLVWRSRRGQQEPAVPTTRELEPLPEIAATEEPVSDESPLLDSTASAEEEQPYPAEEDLGVAEVAAPEVQEPEALARGIPAEAMVTAVAAAAVTAAADEERSSGEEPEPEPVYKSAKMTYKLQYVEGIGDIYAERLKAAGIHSPEALLEKGSTRKGRQELAAATGISEKLVLRWVNHVDLYRIKGVGEEYADLLEAAGVDTVVELALRNPANLHPHLIAVNEQRQLVRQPPSLAQVEDWVTQSKGLPRVVTY
jgi:predicted flap endonuclease-1-like 5' DNA nuclease